MLHIVDDAMRFRAARFVGKRVTAEKVREGIIHCWSSIYTGMPHTISVDEGTQHRDIFSELACIYDINVIKVKRKPITLLELVRGIITHCGRLSRNSGKTIRNQRKI